ncbi:MAG: ribosomal protein S18-alanine N-acetyltransferase [Deltaproteobacteria bacterium]|nr:ribosomal protein S18-alanine N-acetyltransferase [Deltaproteobacteria bacterium]
MNTTATMGHMTAEDLDEILAVESRSFEDPWPEEVFRAELRHCWSHCHVLRSDEDNALLGYIVFWSVADEVHLLNIAVDPTRRHHHHGRMLVDFMLDFARAEKARFVTLEVRRSNVAAIGLYESGGFKQVGVRPKYYSNNGEDAILMLYDLGSHSALTPLPGSGAPSEA